MSIRVLSSLLALVLVGTTHAQPKLPVPTVPDGFDVTIFARPPKVNYPVCLTTDPAGPVLVGIDKQGSLGKKPGDGRVERCVDTDGDGVADEFRTFVTVDHPRGLVFDAGNLWVLHPPHLTLFQDTDGDGKSDKSTRLISGLTTDQLRKRGADHTTNGIRMGIDGWIYIAVGDFGFVDAKGADGRTLTLRGGGIVRVRPDGSEMELYCKGLRNILDVCIDPQLNMFTRDNTNDGGGWDIRLSHIVQSAHYGYPSLFENFADEILPPLADYGGGSGCGGMFLSEPAFPEKYRHALLTCDWGRNAVFFHPLTRSGATYKAGQEEFVKIPRPTDIDADGSGRLFVSSWHGGKFAFAGPNVGYVAQLIRKGAKPEPFPNLAKATDENLLHYLRADSQVLRFHTQREILRRGPKPALVTGLDKLMASDASTNSRVAALFTYKQLLGAKANAKLVERAADPILREFCLRALTDRKTQLEGVPVGLFTKSLKDGNPRVRLAALIGLGRLGNAEAAKDVLALADLPEAENKPQVQTAAYRSGRVEKKKRSTKVKADITGAKKLFLVATDAGDGIGLDHVAWLNPMLVGPDGSKKLTELKWASAKAGWGKVVVGRDCTNKPLRFKGKATTDGIGSHAHSVIEYDLPTGYTTFEAKAVLDDGSNNGGSVRFYVFTDELPGAYQGSKAAVVKDVSKYVLPHVAVKTLVDLKAIDVCLAGLGGPHHSGAVQALRSLHDPKAVLGLIAKLDSTRKVAHRRDILQTLIRLYHREDDYKGTWWGTRPDTTGPYYHRVTWSESPRIEKVLRQQLLASTSNTVEFMLGELARHRVELKNLPADLAAKAKKNDVAPNIDVKLPKVDPNDPTQLGNMPFEKILADTLAAKGNVERGSKLFQQQSCHACHTTSGGQRPIGPSLVDIAKRYDGKQLVTSIVQPNAQIAQGFSTTLFEMKAGQILTGFVIREAADEIEIRTKEGKSHLLKRDAIDERTEVKQSIMPEGLVGNLSTSDLASLVAYLRSLRSTE